ncbi:SRPBCC family protein [Indioceanicola profundi]|uniref:SRPBCC family protein n=1 Tax=Indioceanicola profundi TaxID=2220096 RepID=UPI000E6AB5C8|nr:SRPBCC domain-containing protein [Indioceanicola profundi]
MTQDALTNSSASDDAAFTITREFDASREAVFRAWTEPEQLERWWGPVGFALTVAGIDPRPGGTFLYRMRNDAGFDMWGRFVYREIVRPERMVYVSSFSDPSGGIVRAPFSAEWPLETLSTMVFEDLGGRTRLHLHGVPINAAEAEIRTFKAGHESMRQGWGGTMDQLAAHLAG